MAHNTKWESQAQLTGDLYGSWRRFVFGGPGIRSTAHFNIQYFLLLNNRSNFFLYYVLLIYICIMRICINLKVEIIKRGKCKKYVFNFKTKSKVG